MEIFLLSVFCQNWLVNHRSLRQHANCYDLYSVGDEKDVKSLLTKTNRVLEKHHYDPPLYCSFDIHGQLQTTIQFLIRNVGAQYLILSSQIHYERELLNVVDGGLVALDWITLSHPSPSSATIPTQRSSTTSISSTRSDNINRGDRNSASASDRNSDRDEDEDKDEEIDSASDIPTIILHHGLCGDAASEHIVFMANKFLSSKQQKFRVVVVVMRGCGGLDLMTSQAMHGARTDDLRAAIDHIHRKIPSSRLFGIGFSLGAGIMLKYLGEEGAKSPLTAAYCISPPWDGKKQSLYFPLWSLFLAIPVKLYALRHRQCLKNSIHLLYVLLAPTLGCVDELLTENHGYRTLGEYYSACSPLGLAHNIQVPTLSLSARDDPVCYHGSAPAPAPATSLPPSSHSLSCPSSSSSSAYSSSLPTLSATSLNSNSSSSTSSVAPSSSSLLLSPTISVHHHSLSTPLHSTPHNDSNRDHNHNHNCDSDIVSDSDRDRDSDTEYKEDPERPKKEMKCSKDELYIDAASGSESSLPIPIPTSMHTSGVETDKEKEKEINSPSEELPASSSSSSPVCRLVILKTLLGGHLAFPCTTSSSSSSSLPPSLSFPFSSWCRAWCDDVALDWVLGFLESA